MSYLQSLHSSSPSIQYLGVATGMRLRLDCVVTPCLLRGAFVTQLYHTRRHTQVLIADFFFVLAALAWLAAGVGEKSTLNSTVGVSAAFSCTHQRHDSAALHLSCGHCVVIHSKHSAMTLHKPSPPTSSIAAAHML